MLPSLEAATCTDATHECCRCTQNRGGFPIDSFHGPFHAAWLTAAAVPLARQSPASNDGIRDAARSPEGLPIRRGFLE